MKIVKNIAIAAISILLISALVHSCTESWMNQGAKYKIVGKVNYPSGSDTLRDAIWYVDTFWTAKDTVLYRNSDSSIVKIYPPYKIYNVK